MNASKRTISLVVGVMLILFSLWCGSFLVSLSTNRWFLFPIAITAMGVFAVGFVIVVNALDGVPNERE